MTSRPTPRRVEIGVAVAQAVAGSFGLGELHDVALAARGWVSLNVTWRFTTDSGRWAVKEVSRESRDLLEAAAQIELAAVRLGLATPRVILTGGGAVTTVVDDRVFRCHEFVDGERPGDDLRRSDAAAAGSALGRLHAAALPWDPILMTEAVFGEAHWLDLVRRGALVSAPWVDELRAALPGILAAEEHAAEWRLRRQRFIGSHRDIRPENALRAGDRLVLVDWDGAGPVIQGREVAGALRWWRPHEAAFLAAYEDVVGGVDLEEGSGENGGLVWWLETNVQHALAVPRDEERHWGVSVLAANFTFGT